MQAILEAIAPVFLLIILGGGLRACKIPGDRFWPAAERLIYFFIFPTLIAATLSRADFTGITIAPMAISIAFAITTMTIVLVAARRWVAHDGPAFTSVLQGSIRMNTYIGLSLAEGVHGASGLAAAALAVAVIVPLVNLICVLSLEWCARTRSRSFTSVIWQVARNPLIVACVVGGGLNFYGVGVPSVVAPAVDGISRTALPLGLLVVGAAIRPKFLLSSGGLSLLTCCFKLIALPVLTLLCLALFEVSGVCAFVAVLFNALPTAPSAYILAKQLDGDATLMASLITLQTCFSLITLPCWIALLT